jgi:hypothetical protein
MVHSFNFKVFATSFASQKLENIGIKDLEIYLNDYGVDLGFMSHITPMSDSYETRGKASCYRDKFRLSLRLLIDNIVGKTVGRLT